MEEEKHTADPATTTSDLKTVVSSVIEEFLKAQKSSSETAYKNELVKERKRRESLERRVNELVEENRRSRMLAEEAERSSAIRGELQRLGVAKVDLAFRAVREDIVRAEDGRHLANTDSGQVTVKEYLTQFLQENPELLPTRIPGGSGASAGHSEPVSSSGIELEKIRPGMTAEELDKVRREIARVARQAFRAG